MRAALLALVLALPGAAFAQERPLPKGKPIAEPLDLLLRTGFKRFMAERSSNPVAVEVLEFWQAHPELEFRTTNAEPNAWAVYDPNRDLVMVSRTLLDECGVESHGRSITPASLKKFLTLVAPVIVHETAHAMVDAARDAEGHGAFEEELLAHAYEAAYIAGEPELATAANRAVAVWWRERLQPKIVRLRAAEARSERALVREARSRSAGVDESRAAAAALRKAAVEQEKAHNAVVGEFKKQKGRNGVELQYLAGWGAFDRSWEDFVRLIHPYYPGKPRLAGPVAARRKFVADLREDREAWRAGARPELSLGGSLSDEGVERMLEGAIAFWDDEERVAKARVWMEPRLERVAALAGKPSK